MSNHLIETSPRYLSSCTNFKISIKVLRSMKSYNGLNRVSLVWLSESHYFIKRFNNKRIYVNYVFFINDKTIRQLGRSLISMPFLCLFLSFVFIVYTFLFKLIALFAFTFLCITSFLLEASLLMAELKYLKY